MNWWYSLRKFFFLQTFNAIRAKEHSFVNWEKVKTVSILLADNSATSQQELNEAIQFLAKENRAVVLLSFTEQEKVEGSEQLFSKKSLNWCFVPEGIAVTNFCNAKSDVLFAFYKHENLTMDFIVKQSSAKCRVGIFSEAKTDNFELMINPPTENILSLKKLIEQSITYLQKTEN
ncbi:MAG: hypothetical protein M9931_00580 [Chitinophagales bacterium]|nr:hypothetical protein [Chitinophagales bacterium]OJV24245.1 MAG: hypothetical protein BGO32_04355 [Bacteroidetes bacterium 37-13]HRP39240.1 hypothetical protein [Chitinophagales bacterium]